MKTELSFLLELLLEHKLTTATKKLIQERIKEVEANVNQGVKYLPQPQQVNRTVDSRGVQQAPSTLAIMEQHEQAVQPVIAHTPAIANALQQRQQLIEQAKAGKGMAAPKVGLPK